MRLFVLGATGKTGGALVAQAVARGHIVTTFGRSSFAGDDRAKVLSISGNPMSEMELSDALPGHDAVLSVLGTRGLGATSVLVDSSRATIAAMRKAGVRRLVILSSALLDSHIGLVNRIVGRTLLRHFSSDQRAMEKLVTASRLDRVEAGADDSLGARRQINVDTRRATGFSRNANHQRGGRPRDARHGGEPQAHQKARSCTRSTSLTLFVVFLFLAIYNAGCMTALRFAS